MDFIYQKIGLNNDRLRKVASNLALDVLEEFHGYADNHPVYIDLSTNKEAELDLVVELLKRHKIILYKYRDDESFYGYNIAVLNRYKLELLSAELTWLERPEEERGDDDNTAPFADYVVFYDINTGEMLFNGVYKQLKKTNKRLFDALFLAFPNYVGRKKLISILGASRQDKYSKIIINEAFTNLRKICGVKRYVIQLSSEGGRLHNVETHPLSAQIPPASFLTD